MNESQKRREQLLRETRRLYRGQSVPAVHPRYASTNRLLYGREEETAGISSLGARILVSLLLFVLFAGADYQDLHLWNYEPAQIAAQIRYQPDVSDVTACLERAGLELR